MMVQMGITIWFIPLKSSIIYEDTNTHLQGCSIVVNISSINDCSNRDSKVRALNISRAKPTVTDVKDKIEKYIIS